MNIIRSIPKLISVLSKPLVARVDPDNIQVDITTSCNLRCKMCPRYALDETEQNRSISLEQYKAMIDDILPGSVNLAATGEPFLHPDFFEMVSYARKKSGAVTLTSTNFTTVTNEMLENIVSSGLDILKISIDSPDPATYKVIRGQDHLPKILKNIAALNALKRQRNSEKPSIRIDYVLMKDNYCQITDMVKLAGEIGSDVLLFRLLDTSRIEKDVKSDLVADFSSEKLIEELQKAEVFAIKRGVKTNIGDILAANEYVRISCGLEPEKELKRGVCLLPWLQMFVNVSGNVSPCCSLYPSGKLEEGAMGNIFREGKEKVWNGARMKVLRKIFKEKKNYEVFRACQKCNPMDAKNLFNVLKMFPGIIKFK